MVTLKCPSCGEEGWVGIAPLRPMEAIAAEMIEKGIIFRCSGCGLYVHDLSDINCPACGETALETQVTTKKTFRLPKPEVAGRITCAACGWVENLE
ncbi:MAG TPA: hypothetical protein VKK79_11290 [Candidatus Lokiarchaeia archaeon]|nr:hypothetical protein [Candidatus Lokiarchaeia archaeon]